MKTIKEFINESKRFVLNKSERDALASLIGVLSNNLGDDEDVEFYQLVIDKLTDDEIKQLDSMYDYLDNEETYKVINYNTAKDDIPLIKKIYQLIDDNDLFNNNWDLMDAFEKICL